MNTNHTKRRASQFADELMPRDIWFLAFTESTEAAVFTSQDAMLEYIDAYLTDDEIMYAVSSCMDIRSGLRTMATHPACDVIDWLEARRAEIEAERAHVYRDRMGVPA